MYNPNAYSAYQKTSVSTASQGKLVVLLYEGAVKNLGAALNYFEADGKILPKNIENFGKSLQKAQSIISELEVSLDMEKGGEIAKNLMSLYLYFNEELMQATIGKDKTKIEFVQEKMKDLLSSWRQISESTANAGASRGESILNIQG